MDAVKLFLENHWAGTFFGAFLVYSAWLVWRGSKSRSTVMFNILSRDKHGKTKAPFTRRDFIEKAEPVRREITKGLVIAVVVLIAAPFALDAISRLVPALPRGFFAVGLTILCSVGLGAMFAFAIRGSRMMRRSGLICPACDMELVGTDRKLPSRQDRILETGKCPGCKVRLLDASDVGSESERLTRAENIRYGVLIAVLVLGFVPYVNYVTKSMDAGRLATCTRLYARARTASDSVVIDSTQRGRRYPYTCGAVRDRDVP